MATKITTNQTCDICAKPIEVSRKTYIKPPAKMRGLCEECSNQMMSGRFSARGGERNGQLIDVIGQRLKFRKPEPWQLVDLINREAVA